jgi:fructokinase
VKLGIDLGGSKIEILAIDQHGEERFRRRVSTPKEDYPAILNCIKDLVLTAESSLSESATVGIGTPGSISPKSGLLRGSNSTCLNNKPFKQDLETLLQREIRISNDANCFALSEAVDGAARDANIVFGVIIGTGCGAGIVINRQVLNGPNHISGEWGHNPLPWPEQNELASTTCWCGQHGCIETFLSGPALERDYLTSATEFRSAKEIITLAEQGDELSRQMVSRYEIRMAKSLAHIINILDPHTIVLGGGMSNTKRLYENVPGLWQEFIFSDVVATRLVPPVHGDASGVRGAAWLWNE